jgi:heterotetrameric sarcosine oxidase gamma subunit
LYHTQQEAGARFLSQHAWETPDTYSGAEQEAAAVESAVGLADASWMVKLDLKGFGLRAAPALAAPASCWQLGVCHYLVLCEPEAREATLAGVQALGATSADLGLPPPVYCTEVTSVYAALLVAGPRSRQVLRKLTSLNVSDAALPDGGCRQAGFAHVHAIVLRRDLRALPAFLVLVSRDYAESAWDALTHAGHEFHMAPFGLAALRRLMEG